jgi:hypothetical protein
MPPKQRVSGAGIDYDRDSVSLEGYDLIGTIHSHANFSAFHSGTDHDDETSFDGLHITFGHVASDDFSISASIMSNGQRFYVEPEEYLEGVEHSKVVEPTYRSAVKTYKWDHALKKLVQIGTRTEEVKTNNASANKRYRISNFNPSKDLQFNIKWMDLVEYGYRYNYGNRYWNNRSGYKSPYYNNNERWAYGTYRNPYLNDFEQDMYDWYDRGVPGRQPGFFNGGPKLSQPIAPINGTSNNLPVVIHDHLGSYKNEYSKQDEEDFTRNNPCIDCIHRESKLDWAFNILTSSEDPHTNKNKLPKTPLQYNKIKAADVTHPDETVVNEPRDNPDEVIIDNAISGDFLNGLDTIDLPQIANKKRKKRKKTFKW